jgi:hypothetical protein
MLEERWHILAKNINWFIQQYERYHAHASPKQRTTWARIKHDLMEKQKRTNHIVYGAVAYFRAKTLMQS